jgi:hypothetical protein
LSCGWRWQRPRICRSSWALQHWSYKKTHVHVEEEEEEKKRGSHVVSMGGSKEKMSDIFTKYNTIWAMDRFSPAEPTLEMMSTLGLFGWWN